MLSTFYTLFFLSSGSLCIKIRERRAIEPHALVAFGDDESHSCGMNVHAGSQHRSEDDSIGLQAISHPPWWNPVQGEIRDGSPETSGTELDLNLYIGRNKPSNPSSQGLMTPVLPIPINPTNRMLSTQQVKDPAYSASAQALAPILNPDGEKNQGATFKFPFLINFGESKEIMGKNPKILLPGLVKPSRHDQANDKILIDLTQGETQDMQQSGNPKTLSYPFPIMEPSGSGLKRQRPRKSMSATSPERLTEKRIKSLSIPSEFHLNAQIMKRQREAQARRSKNDKMAHERQHILYASLENLGRTVIGKVDVTSERLVKTPHGNFKQTLRPHIKLAIVAYIYALNLLYTPPELKNLENLVKELKDTAPALARFWSHYQEPPLEKTAWPTPPFSFASVEKHEEFHQQLNYESFSVRQSNQISTSLFLMWVREKLPDVYGRFFNNGDSHSWTMASLRRIHKYIMSLGPAPRSP